MMFSDKDYRAAGFPVLSERFRYGQLPRVTFVWIIATASASMLIPLYGMVSHPIPGMLMAVSALWLAGCGTRLLRQRVSQPCFSRLFGNINAYILILMALMCADRMI